MTQYHDVETRKKKDTSYRTFMVVASWLNILILPTVFYINLLEVTNSVWELETKPIPYFVCILLVSSYFQRSE